MAIQTVRQRTALAPRREPYWQSIGTGQHVGFRRTDDGGHWIARSYDSATRARQYRALGDLTEHPDAERFTVAVRLAREFFEHLGKGGRRESLTVADAWRRYVEHQRKTKGATAAADVEGRLKRHIDGDPIAGVLLEKLAPRHLQEWRERIAGQPAMQPKRGPNCRTKTPPKPPAPRSAGSVNRDMVPMRAALNLALSDGFVTTDHAWRQALKPIKNADGRRTLYLDRSQRRALIEHLPEDAAAFVRGLCLLPLRPGALAALTVADFHPKQGTLRIGTDKAGAGRTVLLPDATAGLFQEQVRGKLPAAPLLARWDGKAWDKDAWKGPIKAAAAAAGLPPETTAYTLRHSVITDLVADGLDLFTVAALAGTSVAMIERHYGHLQQERARDALAGLAL